MRNRRVTVIIGGGIAGLTTAWHLKKAGIPFTLLEQSSSVGGCIRTINEHGYMLELGPNTFLNSSRELWNLARSLGLKSSKIETPSKVGKKRYIFKNEKLIPVPAGPNILFSPILSASAKLRLFKEPFIKRSNVKDESLSSFIRRRLGDEVLETLVTPFVSGIYAGDPDKLSIRAIFPKLVEVEEKYGSIFKGMKALKGDIKSSGLGSFTNGIGTLTQTIESKIQNSVIKNARVTRVEKLNGCYNVYYDVDGETKRVLADVLIVATPAYTTAKLLAEVSDEISSSLSKIEYAPIVVVHTGFNRDEVPFKLDGFGFLVPRKQKIRLLGSLWSSTLFDNRAPEGKVLFTNFIGGMLDPEAIDLTNDDLMRTVQKDLGKILGIKKDPDFACITRYTHAIPQYQIGHTAKIFNIEKTLSTLDGLFLTGSYFRGISVAGTIEHANMIADKAIEYIWRKI